MIMDILEESENRLILGQPFIKTAKMNIDMGKQKMWEKMVKRSYFMCLVKVREMTQTNHNFLNQSEVPGKKKDKII